MADFVALCQGEEHILVVDQETGNIELRDHNLRAELASCALGAPVPVCVQVVLLVDYVGQMGFPRGQELTHIRGFKHFSDKLGRSFLVDGAAAWAMVEITGGDPWQLRWRVVGE